MQVSQLTIDNFRGIRKAALQFSGHTLLIGGNNVRKSTICEALDLVLGPDRLNRTPPVEEFDFQLSRTTNTQRSGAGVSHARWPEDGQGRPGTVRIAAFRGALQFTPR